MFKSISPYDLSANPFCSFDRQWTLITIRGKDGRVNPMTASWGGFGIMWNKPVVTCYVRPQRYTYDLLCDTDSFSLCFLGEQYREALQLCGRVSGRDCDKLAETGLTAALDLDTPYIEQSELVLTCRTLLCQQLDPDCFLDPTIDEKFYNGDHHYMYIAEITDCLIRE